MAKTVVSYVEAINGKLKKLSLECLAASRRLAGSDGRIIAASCDSLPDGAAAELGAHGAHKILVARGEAFGEYSVEAYTAGFAAVIQQTDPDAIVFGYSARGKEIAPRLGARLNAALIPDVTGMEETDGAWSFLHPVYAGKAMVKIAADHARPLLVAVRPNVFPAEPIAHGEPVPEAVHVELAKAAIKTKIKKVLPKDSGKIELTEADIIVSGGRGMKGPENYVVIEALADALGAAVGASRAAVDAGWKPHAFQVGQTGKVVSPTLYIACGISGAIQHLAGMRTSKVIVAVNKDPEAPIFKLADYGVIGDLFEVVPAMTEAVKKLKAAM